MNATSHKGVLQQRPTQLRMSIPRPSCVNFPGWVSNKIFKWLLYKLSLIHISEPTRQEAISYAVFCLKKKMKYPPLFRLFDVLEEFVKQLKVKLSEKWRFTVIGTRWSLEANSTSSSRFWNIRQFRIQSWRFRDYSLTVCFVKTTHSVTLVWKHERHITQRRVTATPNAASHVDTTPELCEFSWLS